MTTPTPLTPDALLTLTAQALHDLDCNCRGEHDATLGAHHLDYIDTARATLTAAGHALAQEIRTDGPLWTDDDGEPYDPTEQAALTVLWLTTEETQ